MVKEGLAEDWREKKRWYNVDFEMQLYYFVHLGGHRKWITWEKVKEERKKI